MLELLKAQFDCIIDSDDTARQTYGLDWTRFYTPDALAVIFPRDIDEVIRLVLFANEHRLPLVPSGGRTGLSGGAVALQRELVVSFDKMNKIEAFDPIDRTVVVQPGVITQHLQEFALANGCQYPVDFASAGSSQIGGNISTNAGGIKVLRYGLTRDWVASLKVVTGRGELLELNKGLVKNATGYDFRHLFIGAEGTLGLIVEATIRLAPAPGLLNVILLAVPQIGDVMSVLEAFRQKVKLTAYEYEADDADAVDKSLEAFEACLDADWATDGVVSASEAQRRDLWALRENISESITPYTPYKNDVAVRVSKVPAFLAAVDTLVAAHYPDFEIVWFGHIGDGNLHLNILKPKDWKVDAFKAACELASNQIMSLVAEFEGSISAEHGVGLLKRQQLKFSRSEAEIDMMRAVKGVFDPNNIMNPGKLIP
jgi:FAD/FMN-containing dehydrogenase